VNRLHEKQDDLEAQKEFQVVLDWLTRVDYGAQQSDFRHNRQEGTGQWLLSSNEFQQWRDQPGQLIYCPGIPGAGKTILASIVVDHLCNEYRSDPMSGIAYIYCSFNKQQEQEPRDLLSSLLKQLLQRQTPMPKAIKELYRHHTSERTRPSLGEIRTALSSIMSAFSRLFIVIDALDECRISAGGQRELLSEILSLQKQTHMNLFTTSRSIPDIDNEFKGALRLEIRASADDVHKYLDTNISLLPRVVSKRPDLQQEIKTVIAKSIDGM